MRAAVGIGVSALVGALIVMGVLAVKAPELSPGVIVIMGLLGTGGGGAIGTLIVAVAQIARPKT